MADPSEFRVTVYAASSEDVAPEYLHAAEELGRLIAQAGWTLVWGGGRFGLDGGRVAGARSAGGALRGVILQKFIDMDVHCSETLDMEAVGDMRTRKAGLDTNGDAFVTLPGGLGTMEELMEILSFKQLGFHEKPVVILNTSGYWDPMLTMIDRAISEGFLAPRYRELLAVAATPAEAVEAIRSHQPEDLGSKYSP